MKPKQQNKIIAARCGWREATSERYFGMWYKKGTHSYHYTTPNYCSDLNAMHEAENSVIYIDGSESDLAFDYLANLVITAKIGLSHSASAAARAEAFLRTIGKWEEVQ